MATIQVREVREDTLRADAARASTPPQAYVSDIRETEAGIPTLDEALAETRDIAAGSGVTAHDILDTLRTAREARAG
ncbi:hypothetical protein [Streptomyces sodiiphilus]